MVRAPATRRGAGSHLSPPIGANGPRFDLDLSEFPTILFYDTGYSIYVLRQASRRSWRIGQRLPVKMKFLHYAETMQETCLRQMGRKLLMSLAMEGKFASEGLQVINDEDDILMAMARELVTEKGIGERADSVWAALQKKQDEVFAVKSSDTKDSMPKAIAEIPTSENAIAPDPWPRFARRSRRFLRRVPADLRPRVNSLCFECPLSQFESLWISSDRTSEEGGNQ
jgi:hypothetical protein